MPAAAPEKPRRPSYGAIYLPKLNARWIKNMRKDLPCTRCEQAIPLWARVLFIIRATSIVCEPCGELMVTEAFEAHKAA